MEKQTIYIPRDFNPRINHPHYLTRNRLLKAIKKNTTELTGTIMDFGCGSKPYKNLFQFEKYLGVDFNNPGHPHLNEEIDVFYDGLYLPFPNDHFDSVFSSEVFEHIFNLPEVLKELNRVVKPGGKILITCPFVICEHEVPNDFARYTSFGIKSILEKNGFEVLKQDKTGNSVETVFQLWITYIHQHISPFLKKIPVIRSAFRFFTYSSLNIFAIFFSHILPNKKDLYLNNILLAKKMNSIK